MNLKIVVTQSASTLKRPIELVDGGSFSTTWLQVEDESGKQSYAQVAFGADFKDRYSDVPLEGHKTFDQAPIQIKQYPVPANPASLLSSIAYSKYVINGSNLPDPNEVFFRTHEAIDRFVSFKDAYGNQDEMAAFLGCFAWSTYAQNIFSVAGYLWTTGEAGSGKSQCLKVISEISFLGTLVVSGSSSASTRDLADIGSTMLFDDCESIRSSDLREILLSGNSKGSSSIKQTPGRHDGEWSPKAFSLYGPRGFSAIAIPDPVLGSRSIMIPFQKSNDKARTQRDPKTPSDWLKPAQDIRDAMWLNTVKHLETIDQHRKKLQERIETTGRDADIWIPTLTIALWLDEECGCEGLFAKVMNVFQGYQKYKMENSTPSELAVLLDALSDGLRKRKQSNVRISTSEIQRLFQEAARNQDISEPSYVDITTTRIGTLMSRSGFTPSKSHGNGRSWMVSESKILEVSKLNGVTLEQQEANPLPEPEVEPDAAPVSKVKHHELPW